MRAARLTDRLYRTLLQLYPAAFRRRHGQAMRHVFQQQYRRASGAGRAARVRFLAASAADVCRSAAAERASSLRERLFFPRHHDQLRHHTGSTLFQTLTTDFTHAWRVFSRAPRGTTFLAIATLALGIGANAAMFSVIYNVLIEPLPYPGADRVVIGWRTNPKMGDVSVSPSLTEAEGWRTSPSVEAVALYRETPMVLAGDEPEALEVVRVDAGLLEFTGARPALGRRFTAADTASEGAARVAILSDGLWKRRFGGTAAVLGQRIELDDQPHEIVGVLPAGFRLPLTDTDVLLPLAPPAPPVKGQRPARTSISALVRLTPSAAREATEEELTALSTPDAGVFKDGWRVRLMPPADLAGATFRRTLFILFGAVGCVLLIACANVAHLVLARNAARRREIAVRVALGASRWRLGRQLFIESLLLALIGGAVGLGIALWGVQAISALRPPQMRQLAGLRISAEVFGFAFLLAMATSAIFGLLPALSAARAAAPGALKQGGPAMQGRRGTLARRTITVAEVALALILLTGAGLLLRSYARVLTTDRGFRPDGLIAVDVKLPTSRYPTGEAQGAFMKNAAAALAALPSVTRVVVASGVPPAGGLIFGQLEVEGHPPAPGGAAFGGGFVQPGFFETLKIPVREGRTFTEGDLRQDVVIVNEGSARRYWPGQSAVGKRLRLGVKDTWASVIGVVGDVDMDHGEAGGTQLYFPLADPRTTGDTTLLLASSTDPAQLIPAIKGRVWELDSRLALDDVESIEQAVRNVTARPRFNVVLLAVFAAIGLTLAMIGIYGVVSYSVGLRTREIGLRMALGALPSTIARGIVGEALVLAAIGAALGLAGALGGAGLMQRMLFEVSPNDPLTLTAVALLLAGTAVVAAVVPARRAMRVDPMVALRME